jgi:hypothetical protein
VKDSAAGAAAGFAIGNGAGCGAGDFGKGGSPRGSNEAAPINGGNPFFGKGASPGGGRIDTDLANAAATSAELTEPDAISLVL